MERAHRDGGREKKVGGVVVEEKDDGDQKPQVVGPKGGRRKTA